ncbi:hypothetical protein PG999_012831 [Apiospora kogelbergensis]|uniref:Uncharacterized protein n=1 Tax=Apiospora kogelbergensis TaxID=1337665 RepID=A0AAW0QA33_9PEZI
MHSSLVFAAAATAIFARGVDAGPFGVLEGRDFGFSVAYESGLTFSTSKPPAHTLSLKDVLYDVPQITFADPAAAAASSPQYLSFLEISSVPWLDGLDDYMMSFPWIQANGTAAANNGTLVGSKSGWRRSDAGETETGEVLNATMHVWRQNPEMLNYLFGAGNSMRMPLFWQVAGIWANTTSRVDTNGIWRASIEFKIRNETGVARCDVDGNGAKITGVKATATCTTTAAASPTPTTPAKGGPSGVQTGASGEPTAASGTESAKSSASCLVTSVLWVVMSLAFILGTV